MITPGIAASLTPTTVERRARRQRVVSVAPEEAVAAAPSARRRLHVPRVLLHLSHLPQRHA